MTAMPPTKGHLRLVEWASYLGQTEVIICTQPGEPFVHERVAALSDATQHLSGVHYNLIHKTLPQEPEGHEGFWDMWADFLHMFGFEAGDYIVASERYGKRLAQEVNGRFMPYDINRELYTSKATYIRERTLANFDQILPEFQPNLIQTVTIFGAESTGKTTLAKRLAKEANGHFLFEYARPYLEEATNEITDQTMTEIWKGQLALQQQGMRLRDKPFVFQDTDLWSTVGYWEMAPWELAGPGRVPHQLLTDATATTSDLYLITTSSIPFEQDPLRYGGDHREITDEQWIKFAEENGLNYVVLDQTGARNRVTESMRALHNLWETNVSPLKYQRQGKEYQTS